MSFARTWLPSQHGAWAMLIAPVVVGSVLGGATVMQAVLLVGWLAAYCLNFFIGATLKASRRDRYRRQLFAYGLVSAICGSVLLAAYPELIAFGVVALPVFIANLWFITRRNERAWLNDILGIVLAGGVGFAAYWIGAATDLRTHTSVVISLLVVTGYFVGTVFYVKTNIRERGSRTWFLLSVGYHAVFTLILALMHWWPLAAVGLLSTIRASLVPGLKWSPKRIGLLEIGFTVAFGLGVLLLD